MSGEIIRFENHRDAKRGRHFREQSAPRSDRAAQIARIDHLLEELKELTSAAGALRPATLEMAGRLLRPPVTSKRTIHLTEDSDHDDPQPEIDTEKLDRMYRDLNSDA